MGIPWEIQLFAWLPFPIFALVGICFSIFYICCYQKSCLFFSGITSILLIALSFIAIITVPVDVFLVSATKNNGSFKDWASNTTIQEMETIVTYIYYGVYGSLLFMFFIILPCAYFSLTSPTYDDENGIISHPLDILKGLRFTFFGILLLTIILAVGILVPMGNIDLNQNTLLIFNQLHHIIDKDCSARWKDGSIFAINCLGIIGMICSLLYTAYGMTILPVNLLKGAPSVNVQTDDIRAKIEEINGKILELREKAYGMTILPVNLLKGAPSVNVQTDDIRAKIEEINGKILELREKLNDHQPLVESDRRLLCHYSLQLSTLQSQNDDIRHQTYSITHKCKCIVRPLQIFVGFLMILMSWLLVISIIVSNINRIVSSMGLHSGYLLNETTIINLIDEILLQTHQYFPMDNILLGIIMFYFAVSTISGMQHLGIWCLWAKIYKIRFRHSSAKSLLFSSFILTLVIIYTLFSLVYVLAPQYATYGLQQYIIYDSNETMSISECSIFAPAEECTMSRLMTFQIELFYRIWIFGAAYYYGSWLFVLVFMIGFVVAMLRARKTVAQLTVNNLNEEFESTEQLLPNMET